MSPEFILQAAVNSMVRGHHKPYCYSAHVPGVGYVNRGEDSVTRADYLRQLERAATAEVENMGWANEYAEPGYKADKGILLANWNNLPGEAGDLLERAGYATEWSDEWHVCECGKAVRTEPDSYSWKPSYVITENDLYCLECAPDEGE